MATLSLYKTHAVIALALAAVLLPLVALAQSSAGIAGILNVILDIFDILVAVLIALALIYFLWGVTKYVGSGDNETERGNGRNMMINGIIALFVIISVWGLVTILVDTFGLTQTAPPFTPQIPRPSGTLAP